MCQPNINILTKRLLVLRPGTELMGLWVLHTVGVAHSGCTNRSCSETTTKIVPQHEGRAAPPGLQWKLAECVSSVPQRCCLPSPGNVVLETGYGNAHFILGRKI